MKNIILLKIVLGLVGAAIIFLGLNVGLGGFQTLGWQDIGDFFEVTDPILFNAQDSHIRFFGGVWSGIGALFLVGAFALEKLRPTLVLLCGVIAVAGLFRFSAIDMETLMSAAIAPSLALELVGFPLLALWLKTHKPTQSK